MLILIIFVNSKFLLICEYIWKNIFFYFIKKNVYKYYVLIENEKFIILICF